MLSLEPTHGFVQQELLLFPQSVLALEAAVEMELVEVAERLLTQIIYQSPLVLHIPLLLVLEAIGIFPIQQ
jgi:hypothetical protein